MRTEVKKWGNSAVVRIPKPFLDECQLGIDSSVEMRVIDGRLLIEPVSEPKFNLGTLLAEITPENCHDEIDFGQPVGREIG